jgi:hypothetical protein
MQKNDASSNHRRCNVTKINLPACAVCPCRVSVWEIATLPFCVIGSYLLWFCSLLGYQLKFQTSSWNACFFIVNQPTRTPFNKWNALTTCKPGVYISIPLCKQSIKQNLLADQFQWLYFILFIYLVAIKYLTLM